MDTHFHRSKPNIDASVTLPSSKSLSHRALITASLADGDSLIHGISESKDTEATMNVLSHLGVQFERIQEGILVHGIGGKLAYDGAVMDCNESGSTLRFLIPLVALLEKKATFTGHGRLMERPQSVYEELFRQKNLVFEKEGSFLHVQGPLQGGEYTVNGDVSSQFISGLLFALPLCKEDSVIHIVPPFESASYVRLTLDALQRSKIVCDMQGNDIYIKGNQVYQPIDCTVEGDDSQMAFFIELAMVQKTPLRILNVNHDSHQGDHVILEIAKRMGAFIEEIDGGYRVDANEIHGTEIDLQDCPDLGPALFCLATQCEGTTTFTHCERLRIKESDRIGVMEDELRKLGCDIHSDGGTVVANGPSGLKESVVLCGHNDHRVVMCLSMLACLSEDITISGSEAINKSYPKFFEDLKRLGVSYDQ